MPDQLIAPAPPGSSDTGRESRRHLLTRAALVVVLCVLAGAVAGGLWYVLWDAPVGYVAESTSCDPDPTCWLPRPPETGLAAAFDGTALYTLVALATGLVVGALAALFLDRAELLALAAVLAGSVLAALVMVRIGSGLGPTDPARLVGEVDPGTRLPGHLDVSGVSPYLALPFGALLAQVAVWFLVPRGWRHRPR